MLRLCKSFLMVTCVFSLLFLALSPYTADAAKVEKKAKTAKTAKTEKVVPGSMAEKVTKANAAFDVNKMSDMSDFYPPNYVIPTGDTIKIAVVAPFSGPGALNGELTFAIFQWAAHDINKRGGIVVDGKRKLVQLIKADHMSKPDQCKKICERMVLQEKVHVLFGTSGSNMMKIMMETANKYKVIVHNFAALSADLMDASSFNRYTFMTTYETWSIGRGLAYYYGQIRKKEKKFYVICQDYSFGHAMADGFKQGLKDYYPEAEVVGEDYHKLFLTDFAPYLTKIRAAGAEVVYTGDWIPDLGTLLKQARQNGIKIPFADRVMDDATALSELGVEGSKGLVNLTQFEYTNPAFTTPEQIKFHKAWHNQWSKWKTAPYNAKIMAYAEGQIGANLVQMYWLMSVFERAKSTDPEKIIKVWENDSYKSWSGKILKMRPCDHKVIQDLAVTEYVPPEEQKISMNIPPYYWFKECSYTGYMHLIPAAKVLPWMDQKLDRCKGKSEWGE